MNYNDLSYILKSNIRFYILLSLKKRNQTPKELASNTFYLTHISTNLKNLVDKGYVKCLNPNDRKNKEFTLTEKSIKMIEYLHKITK